jgi:thiol:disulfide interchange protein
VPVKVAEAAAPGPLMIKGTIRYQICDDRGSCFAPQTTPWSVETTVVMAGEPTSAIAAELFKDYKALPQPPGPVPPPPSRVAKPTPSTTQAASAGTGNASAAPPVSVDSTAPTWNVFIALGVAFGAGILFNIVPCVLPMLPIKVLGFAEISQHQRGKTVLFASVFGLGIVTVFTVLAVLILVLKKLTWGQQFSNPWFAWGMVLLMLVLSLWLFGVLNFNLPSGAYAFTPRHDTYFGNYLWGILTAIFSTPCTGPLFPPLMLWASGQPVGLGVSAMMMVGVGMASPYIALSAFPEAARKFPRVGPWAELFKQMLGFVLLGFTANFAAGRFTSSPAIQWWAVVPVAVMAGLYLMARTVQLSKEAQAVAISSLISVGAVTATVLIACRFSGVFDAKPAGGAGAVNWVPYSEATVDAARKAGKIVLLKFTASWCWNCHLIEGSVYHDAEALAALREHDVVAIKVDLSDDDAPGWKHLRALVPTGGIPLTAIYAPGYEKPVLLTDLYKTATLTKTLDQLDAVRTAAR